MVNLSASSVYKKIEGVTPITAREYVLVARYLQSKGISDLNNLSLTPTYIIIPCDELCPTATLQSETVEVIRHRH